MAKKRNRAAQDATLINIRALKKRVKALEDAQLVSQQAVEIALRKIQKLLK